MLAGYIWFDPLFLMPRIIYGSTFSAFAAMAAKARVISMSVTSAEPNAMLGTAGNCDCTPSLCAVSITAGIPTSSASWTATELMEFANAVRNVHGSAKPSAIVLRLPVADGNGTIDRHHLGAEALLERRQVHKKLEQGAGLPLGLGRAIELAFVVIEATHHREDRSIGSHGDEGCLAYLFAAAFRLEPMRNNVLGNALQIEIEGSAKREISGRGTNQAFHIPRKHVDEIIGAGRVIRR